MLIRLVVFPVLAFDIVWRVNTPSLCHLPGSEAMANLGASVSAVEFPEGVSSVDTEPRFGKLGSDLVPSKDWVRVTGILGLGSLIGEGTRRTM